MKNIYLLFLTAIILKRPYHEGRQLTKLLGLGSGVHKSIIRSSKIMIIIIIVIIVSVKVIVILVLIVIVTVAYDDRA